MGLEAVVAAEGLCPPPKPDSIRSKTGDLLTPTLPATAALKDQQVIEYARVSEPVTSSYVRTTAPFNLSGVPARSVPCGLDPDGLPIGLQIAGRPFDESMVLWVGAAWEAIFDGRQRKPLIHVGQWAVRALK